MNFFNYLKDEKNINISKSYYEYFIDSICLIYNRPTQNIVILRPIFHPHSASLHRKILVHQKRNRTSPELIFMELQKTTSSNSPSIFLIASNGGRLGRENKWIKSLCHFCFFTLFLEAKLCSSIPLFSSWKDFLVFAL